MEDIFREEPIYSKPIDVISIASGSSTQYEEPWSDPDIEMKLLKLNLVQQIRQSK
ncbi:hypothetical protein ACJKRE_07985 (plasmid) [Rickettsia amblyommatis]